MKSKLMFIPFGCREDLRQRIGRIPGRNARTLFPKYEYVLSRMIYWFTMYNDKYDEKGVPFNMERLASDIGDSARQCKQIIDNLIDWKYLVLFSEYKVGISSRCYKLDVEIEEGRFSMVRFYQTDGKLINKLITRRGVKYVESDLCDMQRIVLENHISVSQEGLNYLRDSYPGNIYIEAITDMYGYDELSNLGNEVLDMISLEPEDIGLFAFIIGNFFVTRPDPKSRIYSNLTSLKREHRRFLLLDGLPVMETDLVNSQPLFAIPVIENHIKKNPGRFDATPDGDMLHYRDQAQDGKSYESVAAFHQDYLEFNDRRKFKVDFYKQLFFSKVSEPRTKIQKSFGMLFPTFLEVMNDIKKDHHGHFAIMLQRAEATLIIDDVMRRLFNLRIPALSLHDSGVVRDEIELELVERIVTEAMDRLYSLRATFKRKTNAKEVEEDEMTKIIRKMTSMKEFSPSFDDVTWLKEQMMRLRKRQMAAAKIAPVEESLYGRDPIQFDGGTIHPKNRKVRFKHIGKTYQYTPKKFDEFMAGIFKNTTTSETTTEENKSTDFELNRHGDQSA